MECPKCKQQFDIYNAEICEEGENEGLWICPDCKVPLNEDDIKEVKTEDEDRYGR